MAAAPTRPTFRLSRRTDARCAARCAISGKTRRTSKREITAKELEILPNFKFVNITGGEPFVRRDLEDIVEVMFKKSRSHRHFHFGLAHRSNLSRWPRRFPNIGIRVSIEGLAQKNDDLRGRDGSFDRGHAAAADAEGNGRQGYRLRLHGVEQEFGRHALAVQAVARAGHGVRHRGVPQFLLLPQGRQRDHQQGRGDRQLPQADRGCCSRRTAPRAGSAPSSTWG